MTVDQLGELFNAAYLKAATIENAISGLKFTGIIPLNPDVLPESEFLEDLHETFENDQPTTPNTVFSNSHDEIPSADSCCTVFIPPISPTMDDEIPATYSSHCKLLRHSESSIHPGKEEIKKVEVVASRD